MKRSMSLINYVAIFCSFAELIVQRQTLFIVAIATQLFAEIHRSAVKLVT